MAREQAAPGWEIRRVSWQGIRGQCLRAIDLNTDLRNSIGKVVFPPQVRVTSNKG